MLRNSSLVSSGSVCRPFARIAASALLLLALSIAAGAYTLVLRDGRRMEIASEFTLTKSTLTYEIAPGVNRTVQLVLVDVAATERANNEAPGSFAKRAEQKIAAPSSVEPARAQRTLTNRDLETIQQRRIESERTYEKRRVELGLPSIEESRRRQEEEDTATRDWLHERSLAQARDEASWRERASAGFASFRWPQTVWLPACFLLCRSRTLRVSCHRGQTRGRLSHREGVRRQSGVDRF